MELERTVQLLVEPRIQEEQSDFCLGHGTLDQLYTLAWLLEGAWDFAEPDHMCFVDVEKAYGHISQSVLWAGFQKYGVDGLLLWAIQSLYCGSQSFVFIAGSKSDPFPVRGCSLPRLSFVTGSAHNFHGQNF